MKKTIIKAILFIILLILIVFMLVTYMPKKYTITMKHTAENGVVKTYKIKVKKGTIIEQLKIPNRRNYKFLYWTNNGEKCDMSEKITKDMVLESVWERNGIKKYTVNFDTDGGNEISPQIIEEGKKAIKSTIPIKKGYTFIDWMLNGNIYDFNTPVTSDLNLVAKWQEQSSSKIEYTVMFDSNGGNTIPAQIIEKDKKVIKPNNPTKKGYTFIAWLLKGETYNFNTPVTSDLNLVAKWHKQSSTKIEYTVMFDSDGGNTIPTQIIEKGKKVIKPNNPTKNGYSFIAWSLKGKTYNFNTPVTSDLNLVAKWKKKESATPKYSVSFDTHGGNKIENQIIEEGNIAIKPATPLKSGYEFVAWKLNNTVYNFGTPIYKNIKLEAVWKIKPYVPATINYSLADTSGKWIYMNNPERIINKYLTDTTGKALYSDHFNGKAEIYFEYNIQNEVDNKTRFALRFYNPGSKEVTLKINKCGSTIVRSKGQRYVTTWAQYYDYESCSMKERVFNIAPNSNRIIYLKTTKTGTGWDDYTNRFSTNLYDTKIPTGIIDGVLNVTSNGKLNVESFFFKDPGTIPTKSYDRSDNYIDTDKNKAVYSGYYNAFPKLTSNINFEVYDTTNTGLLSVKYNTKNSQIREIWYTHNLGNIAPAENAYIKDSILPITTNNKVTNWANWAVRYNENIKLTNEGNKTRKFAYYVNSYGAASGKGAAVIAFPTNKSLNYSYKRTELGLWRESNEFFRVWEITVPAYSSVTVPTTIILGGNSVGTIGHKVEMVE